MIKLLLPRSLKNTRELSPASPGFFFCRKYCINKQQQEHERPQVKASVYRLRDHGIKLPRPLPPRSGDVQLSKIERSDLKYLQARLLDGSIDLLPPLHKASVARVSRNGMVIHGIEMVSRKTASIKARVSTHQQTWWVLVVCEELNGVDLLEEISNGEDPLEYLPNAFAMPTRLAAC
jgi:hypothetical protein